MLLLFFVFELKALVGQAKEYNPFVPIEASKLKLDLGVLKSSLEKVHPSLYWFTPKQTIDSLFKSAEEGLTSPINELEFENKVSSIISNIKCGHTSVQSSKKAMVYYKKHFRPVFPFGITPLKDTLVVGPYQILGITRGARIFEIDGLTSKKIMDTLRQFISGDGNTTCFKDAIIRRNFGPYFRDIVGVRDSFELTYLDTNNAIVYKTVKAYNPKNLKTSTAKKGIPVVKQPKLSKRQQADKTTIAMRNLRIDTANSLAIMSIRTFKDYGHRRFFRKSFKLINKLKLANLAIDLRDNGGGLITNSLLLLKYLKKKKFTYCDSTYGITKRLPNAKNFKIKYYEMLTVKFMSRKRKDGLYHSSYLDKHIFWIKRKSHFDGQVFLITNGYTFSAASLTTAHLKGQQNVKIIGEETGGGVYGNSAVIMAELTLPNSKIEIRVPMYRMVMKYKPFEFGRGVLPDIKVEVTTQALKEAKDLKLEKIYNLIKTK